MPNHYVLPIPYNLTPSEVVMESISARTSAEDLPIILRNLLDRSEDTLFDVARRDNDMARICLAAVILHKKFPERSFAACLDTAMVWEFG